MIYLASPYTHKDLDIQHERFIAVCEVAGKLMREGKFIFSPIAHSHPVAVYGELPTTWEFWAEYDTHVISLCDELIVLRLPGWDVSKGVTAEIEIAKRLGKPVSYIDSE